MRLKGGLFQWLLKLMTISALDVELAKALALLVLSLFLMVKLLLTQTLASNVVLA